MFSFKTMERFYFLRAQAWFLDKALMRVLIFSINPSILYIYCLSVCFEA